MEKRIGHRTVGKLAAAAAVGLAGFGTAQQADAALIIDIRATAINGVVITPTKSVTVAPGDQVRLDVFAQVSGTNAERDELIQSMMGNIQSGNGGLLGNMVAVAFSSPGANFRGSGAQNGAQVDLDGDGDLDIGTIMTDQTVTAFFGPRSAAQAVPVTQLPNNVGESQVGRVTFTVSSGGTGETFVNFIKRVEENGAPASEGAVWFEDGGIDEFGNVQAKNPFNPTVPGAVYEAGSPVQIVVPEPTGLALAGLATIGLLARRRNNAK